MANRFIGGVLSSKPQTGPSISRASTGTYFNSSGVLTTAPINQPRLNYTYSGTSWRSPSLLIESASTNILTYSQNLSNAAWQKANVTVGSTTTAPDGTNTAYLMVPSTGNAQHYFYNSVSSLATGSNAVASCFVKAGGYNFITIELPQNGGGYVSNSFNLSAGTTIDTKWDAGTLGNGTITPVGNGWYRISVYCQNVTAGNFYIGIWNAGTGGTLSFAGDGTSGVYVWGLQVETGYTATSYIPTTSAAVTRSADVVAANNLGLYSLNNIQNTKTDSPFTLTQYTTVGQYSWTCPSDVTSVELLVVGGGGGGGSDVSGGGGGGGVLYYPSYPVTPGRTYTVVVGAGGTGQPFTATTYANINGKPSQFGSVVAYGGGGGGSWVTAFRNATSGASGGGAYPSQTGGQNIPGQGYPGGSGSQYNGGGGAGGPALSESIGNPARTSRAPGLKYSITGTMVEYGYGGAGCSDNSPGDVVPGVANTGGGGDGTGGLGQDGGSGTVVIKYKNGVATTGKTQNTATVVQRFTKSAVWTVPAGVTQVEALIVAGGGGGGYGRDVTNTGSYGAGGGGAGGLIYNSSLSVTPGSTYTIGVGTGGKGGQGTTGTNNQGYNGYGSAIGTGSELISNGSGFSATTGWSATTATLSVPVTGIFRIVPDSGLNGTASQSITTAIGSTYVVVVRVVNDAAKLFRLRIGTTQVGSEITDFFTAWSSTTEDGTSGIGIYSTTFTATSTTTWINLQVGGGTSQITEIDYISARLTNTAAFGGGGGGGVSNSTTYSNGKAGGSGGGGAAWGGVNSTGGAGTAGQGFAGGTAVGTTAEAGGGGGGAGGAGGNANLTPAYSGRGGNGLPYSITGNLEYYAGGGSGGGDLSATAISLPGLGGGGRGGNSAGVGGQYAGENAAPNTGGGGGGAGALAVGGNGGSGVIILKYQVPNVATFLNSGTWTCPAGVTRVQALVVAGGGGGGAGSTGSQLGGGGGGAGGLIYSTSVPVTPGVTYPIVVGQGGKGGITGSSAGTAGENSAFGTLVAVGGGYGGVRSVAETGGNGGSSGAACGNPAAAGNNVYGQGNLGAGSQQGSVFGGGGGGAGAIGSAGQAVSEPTGGTGGAGIQLSISGTATWYASGGSSGAWGGAQIVPAPANGGGAAGGAVRTWGYTGAANTGGGGGGGGSGYRNSDATTAATGNGGMGGSGIVILRWAGA